MTAASPAESFLIDFNILIKSMSSLTRLFPFRYNLYDSVKYYNCTFFLHLQQQILQNSILISGNLSENLNLMIYSFEGNYVFYLFKDYSWEAVWSLQPSEDIFAWFSELYLAKYNSLISLPTKIRLLKNEETIKKTVNIDA